MLGRKKKTYDYFDTFVSLGDYSLQAAKYLNEVLNNYDEIDLDAARINMHGIEHAADEAKTAMMKKLIDEFLPPLDRDDIISLSHYIDDVTDAVEDVLIRYVVFGNQKVRQDSLEFTELIADCCQSMNEALAAMKNYNKTDMLFDHIGQVKELKSKGDALYVRSLRKLYQEENTPDIVMACSEIYQHMKRCCDRCKLVTNEIERIVMKNL